MDQTLRRSRAEQRGPSPRSTPPVERQAPEDTWAALWRALSAAGLSGAVARTLREGPSGPEDLYLRHLVRAAASSGADLSRLVPGNASPSWTRWLQPYYRVLEGAPAPEVELPEPLSAAPPTQQAGESDGAWLDRVIEAPEAQTEATAASAPVPVSRDAAGEADPRGELDWFLDELRAISAGRPLSALQGDLVEAVHGQRLPTLRLHDDARSRRLAAAVDARAFTVGDDVYLGEVAADTEQGAVLLAHEATHVLQHVEGRIPAPRGDGLSLSRPGEPHEREAERAEQRARNLYADRVSGAFGEADPWGLRATPDSSPEALALLRELAADLPDADTEPPEAQVREGLDRLLTAGVDEALEPLHNVVAAEPELHGDLEAGLARDRRALSAAEGRTDDEGLRQRLALVGAPGPDALAGLQRDFAAWPRIGLATAALSERLVEGPAEGEAPAEADSPAAMETVARKGAGLADPSHPSVRAALAAHGGGRPLPSHIRQELEQRLGADLSRVRVHTDDRAAEAAEALRARAFTAGQDVFFSAGRYAPDQDEGRALLAHELVHTVQNQRAAASSTASVEAAGSPREAEAEAVEAQVAVSTGAEASEREAEQAADAALRGEDVAITAAPAAELARGEEEEGPETPGNLRRSTTHGGANVGAYQFKPDGQGWRVVPVQQHTPGGVRHSGPEATGTIDGLSTSDSVNVGEVGFGDEDAADNVASGTLEGPGAGYEAGVSLGADGDGYSVKAAAGANITLVSGELVIQTPALDLNFRGESIRGRLGIRVTAAVVAEASGEVGGSLSSGDNGVGLSGGVEAFAGAKAGCSGFISLKWRPAAMAGGDYLDVAGASYGIAGWAGAAAAANMSVSLTPSLKVEFVYGLAWGVGASTKGALEIHLENAAMFAICMAGRGAALMMESLGMTYLARGLDRLIDEAYADDAARAAIDAGIHLHIPVPRRIALLDKMLSGSVGNDDEAAVLKVFRDASDAGEIRALAYGVAGGVLRLYDKFDGEERAQLLALLYTSGQMTDIAVDDDVARELVRLGIHTQGMDVIVARRMVEAMLDGFTGDDDEAAILRVIRERGDHHSLLTQHLIQRCLEDFNGEEYDALAGFLWLEGMIEDGDIDDDVARAVINQGMHASITDTAKLTVLLDELISGATGDDDEACIVRLLMDRKDFTRTLPEDKLEDCLSDVDGEEYEDLLVALRQWDRILLNFRRYDVDDNVARKIVAAGVHTRCNEAELRLLINELISGMTGNDDEAAIISILNDNRGRAAGILNSAELRQDVLDNLHGDEYDEGLALYCVLQLMPDIEVDDDVARAVVRLNLHTQITDGAVHWSLIEALLDGVTGDDDEAAILRILAECGPVRSHLSEENLARIGDDLHGEEYERFIVWGRLDGIIPDVTADWVDLDDDVARTLVDNIGSGAFSAAEIKALVDAMIDGFTGDADEDRLMVIFRARVADCFTGVDDPRIDTAISNMHGEQETELFVLLFQSGLLRTDPWHADFDDDTAREFVRRNFHTDTAKMGTAAVRGLVGKLTEGFAGDEDEVALRTLVNDRSDAFTGPDDALINGIIACTHGEEETELFVTLYQRNLFSTDPLHADFDDDTARRFVDEGFHTDGGRWSVAAATHLITKMLEGSTGDDDEDRVLRLLTDRNDVAAALPAETLTWVLDDMDGEQELAAFKLLWDAGQQEAVLGHEDFDDDIARHFIDNSVHTGMTDAQRVKLVDAMMEGGTFDDDEDHLLRLFRETPTVLDSLDEARVAEVLNAFDGEQWDQLFVLLYKANRGGLKPLRRFTPRFDDDTARLMVDEGVHTTMTAEELVVMLDELAEGFAGDDDEDRMLTLLTDRWSTVSGALTDPQLVRYDAVIDGEQSDRYRALLWKNHRLPDSIELDDNVARGLIASGEHLNQDDDACRTLLRALLDGATLDDDEAALLTLLGDKPSLVAALTDADIDELISDVHGEEDAKLVVLLFRAGRLQLSDERLDDDAARELVAQGAHVGLSGADKGALVGRLLSGACMEEDEQAILTLLRSDTGQIPAIVAQVSVDELLGDVGGDNLYDLGSMLYDAGVSREAVVGAMDSDGAMWLVRNDKLGAWSGAHRAKLYRLLLEAGSNNETWVAIRLLQAGGADVSAFLAEVPVADANALLSGEALAETMFAIWEAAPDQRQAILENASGVTADRLCRARAYDAMTDAQRLLLIDRLLADDRGSSAFEVCQVASDQGRLAALVTAAGGEDALLGRFSGQQREDVRRLLHP